MKPPRTIHSSGGLDVARAQRVAPSLLAPLRVHDRRTADVRDGAAAEVQQVIGRQVADALVVCQHAVAFHARVIVPIDHHEGGPLLGQLLQQAGDPRAVRRREDDAVDLAAAQHLELRLLFLRVLAGAAQQQSISARAGHRLDAGDDLDEERVHQVGDDDAEGVGAAKAEAAGNRVTLVAEFFDLGEDAGAGGLADVGAIVEHLGDGGDGDTELAGDPLHGGRVHAGSSVARLAEL
jgi:hypothetical protein